jgi:hypothetical protein
MGRTCNAIAGSLEIIALKTSVVQTKSLTYKFNKFNGDYGPKKSNLKMFKCHSKEFNSNQGEHMGVLLI